MENLNQLLDYGKYKEKIKRVHSEYELIKRYPLFQRSYDLEHSNQYFLLNKNYEGLYEKICNECKRSKNNFNILFYISELDCKLQIYVTQNFNQQKIEYLPLNQLREYPQPKNFIYQVIQNKTGANALYSNLLLLPNENIILGRFSIEKIPIQIPCKIYYNSNDWFEIIYAIEKYNCNQGYEKQNYYVGEINDKFNPLNEGYFRNPKFQITATFSDGFFTGKFQIEKFYDNNKSTFERNIEKILLPLCYYQDNLIDYFTFKTIFEGRWINQKVMDFYLDRVIQEYKVIKDKSFNSINYQNYLVNSCDCADIFSSDIFDQQYYSEQKWKVFQSIHNIDINNLKNRFILSLNIQRSHFIVLVLEFDQIQKQGIIYLLDTIPKDFTPEQMRIGKQNIQSLFPNLKIQSDIIRIKEIEKQRNGYDCGIHCIYNSLLVFKEQKKKIVDIDFKISDKSKINRLRRHVYMTMVNNYSNWFEY